MKCLLELGLAQIYPIWDEDTDEERVAVSASLVDPFIAILRDDASLLLLQADESGDLDEVTLPENISSLKCRSICLYKDQSGIFGQAPDDTMLFLLTSEYKILVRIECPLCPPNI